MRLNTSSSLIILPFIVLLFSPALKQDGTQTSEAVVMKDARSDLQKKAKELYGIDAPQIVFASQKSPKDMTTIGQVETGVLFKEATDRSEIFLDMNPCKSKVIAFHKPYTKQNAVPVKCGEKYIPQITVTQK
jgi:hypothetical protein